MVISRQGLILLRPTEFCLSRTRFYLVFRGTELMFWCLTGCVFPLKALEKGILLDLLSALIGMWITPYHWGHTTQRPSFLQMALGPVSYLEQAQVNSLVPMYLLKPYPQPQTQLSGQLSTSNSRSPRQLFTAIALRFFFTFPPEISIFLACSCL